MKDSADMGYKYEVEVFIYERRASRQAGWEARYQGNSRIGAELALWKARRSEPGRAYRLIVR